MNSTTSQADPDLRKVAIVGASGYSGEELCALLDRHPSAEVTAVFSRQHAGKSLGEVMPRFSGLKIAALLFTEADPANVAACDAGVIFLALPGNPYVLGVLLVLAAVASGAFYTPGMAMLTNAAEARGLEYGYAFALINIMWAPGQVLGSVAGGSLAQATSDRVPYAVVALACAVTFFALHGRRDAHHQART
jgi:MFS family permease